MLPEFDQVGGDGLRGGIFRSVGLGLVGVVGFHNRDDLLRVDWDIRCADAVLRLHDEIGGACWRFLGQDNVMKTRQVRGSGVDLDDDLIGHLDQFGGCADGSTRDDTTLFGNGGGFNHDHIELGVGLVQCVPSLSKLVKLDK